ncbi:adhesion G-protein coupled receptor G4-like isoform X1 [Hydra vulgaris]|uniref:Adhesion G-protein coupled receptor G4-like isoform X1 n=1 Tax=Hydra vulgaris TaxID=6087 RepID=A0ABM4CQR9_HYDVU
MICLASLILISLIQNSKDCRESGCKENEVCEERDDDSNIYSCKCASTYFFENGTCREYLSNWSLWSVCSVTCRNSANTPRRTRDRTCLRNDGCPDDTLTDTDSCDVPECTDCRATGCKDKNEICKNYFFSDYNCKCNSKYFRENGTCKDCYSSCFDLKKCKYSYFDDENYCECIPNYILVNGKCTAASSQWNSWGSPWYESGDLISTKNMNGYRLRDCLVVVDKDSNETQDCFPGTLGFVSDWGLWSECSSSSNITRNNRTRIKTCKYEYIGENCTGALYENFQPCPGFAYTYIIILLNKTWNNNYLKYFSKSSEDLRSWFSDFTKEFEKWFKRFSPLLFIKSDLIIKKYLIYGFFKIAYSVDTKDLIRSCSDIESSLTNQKQIMNCSISLFFIGHSDCCFSTIYNPFDAFMIEYFTGLEKLNFSLAGGYSNLSCSYNKSKVVNAYCVFMDAYDFWYTLDTFTNIAVWSYDEIFDCPAENDFSQSLLNLNKSITVKNADEIAANLSSNLIKSANITIIDFQLITDVISGVVQASSMSANVTQDIISVVSTLLNQNTTFINEANMKLQTSNELLNQLDRMAAKQVTNVNVSTQNLAFASYFYEKNNSDVYIYSENNDNSSIIISSKNPENGSESNLPYITLPSQLFFNKNNTLVYSFIFKQVDLFMNMQNQTGNINSVVLSATLKDVFVNKSNTPIIMRFTKNLNASGNTSCGFFDTKYEVWSTEGCSITNSSLSGVICECDHLTNFALLLNVAQSVDTSNAVFLEIITWIGCGLSIAGLFMTIVSYSVFSKLRKKLAPKILLSLCVSLMCTLIIFLASETPSKPSLSCKIVASLLQFFVLSTFFWMAIEGLNLYRMFVKVFHGSSSSHIFFLKASAFAWGIPFIVSIATAAIKPNSLGPASIDSKVPQVCVVQGYPFYFGILLPVCVIMAGNICVLFFVLRGVSVNSNINNKIDIKKKVRIAFACSALLGLTWIFAILAVGKATAVFQWLFCIFNSLQGFFVFLFYTVGNKQVKVEWMQFIGKKFGCFKSVSHTSRNTISMSVSMNTLETKF